jgi:uncharacterized membrane protein YfcA
VPPIAEPARIIGMCALIFVSCAGLGTAAFWTATRTDEPITRREVLMVIRALFAAALSAWLLLFVTPQHLVRPVGAFFLAFSAIVLTLLIVTHRRVHQQYKKQKEEGSPYE